VIANLMAVTVMGVDRPGIVASVTKVLFDAGCNLEDATSSILRGHFAMTLVVRVPDDLDASKLEDGLAPVARDLGLVATVRSVEDATTDVSAPTHMVSVYGADRPGIVYKVTELLASTGANITDLTSRVIGSSEEPVYALMLEVVLADPQAVERRLQELHRELDVEVSVHPIEPDML
jgi:glycine cleavage system transcriptional repressor